MNRKGTGCRGRAARGQGALGALCTEPGLLQEAAEADGQARGLQGAGGGETKSVPGTGSMWGQRPVGETVHSAGSLLGWCMGRRSASVSLGDIR